MLLLLLLDEEDEEEDKRRRFVGTKDGDADDDEDEDDDNNHNEEDEEEGDRMDREDGGVVVCMSYTMTKTASFPFISFSSLFFLFFSHFVSTPLSLPLPLFEWSLSQLPLLPLLLRRLMLLLKSGGGTRSACIDLVAGAVMGVPWYLWSGWRRGSFGACVVQGGGDDDNVEG